MKPYVMLCSWATRRITFLCSKTGAKCFVLKFEGSDRAHFDAAREHWLAKADVVLEVEAAK